MPALLVLAALQDDFESKMYEMWYISLIYCEAVVEVPCIRREHVLNRSKDKRKLIPRIFYSASKWELPFGWGDERPWKGG